MGRGEAMALSKFQRICKILEVADRPLLAREIAARDPCLESREVGLIIHHNSKPGEIKIIMRGEVRHYQLVREGT